MTLWKAGAENTLVAVATPAAIPLPTQPETKTNAQIQLFKEK
jgi:hypothetical protein